MNVNKLRGLMVENGYTYKKMAETLGIAEKTFWNKMQKGVFGVDEAQTMIKVLNIKNPSEIFFS